MTSSPLSLLTVFTIHSLLSLSLFATMKSGRRTHFSSSSYGTTVTYTFKQDHSTPHLETNSTELPTTTAVAAVKIQSAYRSHTIRILINKIRAVNSESNKLERLIQRQETVDAVRSDDRERIKFNEALMSLLLTLDSIPGFDPTVRELRRRVSRRIVGLQEILDSVCEARVGNWDGFLREWDDVIEGIEEEVCREKGGREMERFCAENLGFRCFERFLRQQ